MLQRLEKCGGEYLGRKSKKVKTRCKKCRKFNIDNITEIVRQRCLELQSERVTRSHESTSLGARPCRGPSAHRGKNTRTKGSFIGGGKRGRRDERRGNTVQRHLRAV